MGGQYSGEGQGKKSGNSASREFRGGDPFYYSALSGSEPWPPAGF